LHTSGTDGQVIIGASATSLVRVGGAVNYFSLDVDALPPLMSFVGTANISLPNNASARFQIETVPVSANVTAANLGILTAGPTSDADDLHTHTGIGAVTASSGEAITANACIAMGYNGSNVAKAYHCDITSTPGGGADGPLPTGFAVTGVAIDTDFVIRTSGEVTIPTALWEALPAATDGGKPVYAYGTGGGVSLTAPVSGSGDYRTKVGILKSRTASDATIIIQIGDSVLMA
jgi:hypothetical protein